MTSSRRYEKPRRKLRAAGPGENPAEAGAEIRAAATDALQRMQTGDVEAALSSLEAGVKACELHPRVLELQKTENRHVLKLTAVAGALAQHSTLAAKAQELSDRLHMLRLQAMNARNAEFWAARSAEFADNISKHPYDAEVAAEMMSQEAVRSGIKAVPSMESIVAHLAGAHAKDLSVSQARKGKRPRPDGLQRLIEEIVARHMKISLAALIAELHLHEHGAVIDTINEDEDVIEWHDEKHPGAAAPISGLKDRLSRAKKRISSR